MTTTTELMPALLAPLSFKEPPVREAPFDLAFAPYPLKTNPLETDALFYGHRLRRVRHENGREETIYSPIHPKDFLDPEDGDHFVQGTCHDDDVDTSKSVLRRLHEAETTTAVYSDLKIFWGIQGLSNPAPDVSIIPNVQEWRQPRQSFDVQEEGARPRFVLEIVSPNYVTEDYEDKVGIYEQAGVEEYIIVDSGLRPWSEVLNYRVSGYRLEGERYVKIQPDAAGRIYSQVNQVWFAPRADRQNFEIIHGQTGELLLPDPEELARERMARIQAQDRAEVAEEEALRANQQAEQERLIRLQAEADAEAERKRAEAERKHAEAERKHAEAERKRADAEGIRAEAERERAEAERLTRIETETKLAKALARLRALGIEA